MSGFDNLPDKYSRPFQYEHTHHDPSAADEGDVQLGGRSIEAKVVIMTSRGIATRTPALISPMGYLKKI